jgi:hypothetical protein
MSDKTEITNTTIGNRSAPTLARLNELLIYKRGVGLIWRVQRGRARRGDVAGGRANRDRQSFVSVRSDH